LELMESIRNIANRDYLTGLYNRRFFFDEGYNIYEKAKERGVNVFVAMIDVDHFKKVNDTHGHDCGDLVLKNLAAQLSEHFPDDLIARLGGEEFTVLITDENIQTSTERLGKFCRHIEQEAVKCGMSDVAITISIGGSHKLLGNLDLMLIAADQNLYLAKQNGKNRVVV
ncbi:MAG: GGDEF domain-containing protein, partial [Gallionella sp.]